MTSNWDLPPGVTAAQIDARFGQRRHHEACNQHESSGWQPDPLPEVNYSLLPMHMQEPVQNYVEIGSPIGGFLTAVLSNDLAHAYGAADEANTAAMRQWAMWLFNEAPSKSWGSASKVAAWQQSRREPPCTCDDIDQGLSEDAAEREYDRRKDEGEL